MGAKHATNVSQTSVVSPFDDIHNAQFGLTPGEVTFESPEGRRPGQPPGPTYTSGSAADLRAKNVSRWKRRLLGNSDPTSPTHSSPTSHATTDDDVNPAIKQHMIQKALQ